MIRSRKRRLIRSAMPVGNREQRLSLYVKFARARLVGLEQMRSDPKTKDRPQQTHDSLDDFLLIYDELNDNIETYVDRKNDIRKPLKVIIDADTEFEAKLRALRDAADVSAEEAKQYEFVLTNALDTIDTSAEEHRKLLAEQEEAAKHRKKADSKQSGDGRSEDSSYGDKWSSCARRTAEGRLSPHEHLW